MTPVIKGPLEQLFDTQFHTGRKLSDLRPTGLGSLFGYLDEDSAQPIAQFLANTPATRAVSTIDKLADDRKGVIPKALNLLTGFKISDVNMDKMRAIDAREALVDLLSRTPNVSSFENFYVRPGDMDKLTPQDIQMLRLFAYQKEQARKVAEQERMKGK